MKLCAIAVTTILLAVASAISPDGKCRILAMRGGGVHGTFEAGAIKALAENLDPIDVHWDVISGVSIGAINTGAFTLFDFGEEKEAAEFLIGVYTERLPQDYWSMWPTVLLEPFWKSSMMNNEGLVDLINSKYGLKPIKRKMSVQSVDLNTGKVVIFDETIPIEMRNKVILSSGTIPGFFPPVEIDGMQLVDGGTFQNLAIGDPIQRCREEVTNDEDIIIDILLCFSTVVEIEQWTLEETKWKDALGFYKRKKELNEFYGSYEDMLRVTRGFPDVKIRYVVAPHRPPPSDSVITISATLDEIWEEINLGYEAALLAIEDAVEDGTNFDNMLAKLRDMAGLDSDAGFDSHRRMPHH